MTKQSVNATSPAFLVQMFELAKAYGDATRAVIALLRSARVMWGDKAVVGPIAEAFKFGRLAGILNVKRDEAARICALHRWRKDRDMNDKSRSYEQQQAYRAAISAWSYCALAAGMPNLLTGTTRKPRTATTIVGSATSTAPIVLERVIIPTAPKFDDVKQFARQMAALIRKFEAKNAKTSFGEYRSIFDGFVDAITALGNAETVINAAAVAIK